MTMKLGVMEEYESNENESEDNTSWFWSKAVTVGKKVLAAGVVVSSAPLLVPLFVLALFASVPYCFFLANYACTQKLMSSLLPANEETSGTENDDSGFEYRKLDHGEVPTDEQILSQFEEDAEMAKESTSLIERLRDEGRTDERTSEKDDEKSEKVQDQEAHEGRLEEKTTETLNKKDEEPSANEVYSEEQIWEKMEALRKIVGYRVASSSTYAEELKALYVFIGAVEPPPSGLNHGIDHDIAHVTLRLRFLMSLFGIN